MSAEGKHCPDKSVVCVLTLLFFFLEVMGTDLCSVTRVFLHVAPNIDFSECVFFANTLHVLCAAVQLCACACKRLCVCVDMHSIIMLLIIRPPSFHMVPWGTCE